MFTMLGSVILSDERCGVGLPYKVQRQITVLFGLIDLAFKVKSRSNFLIHFYAYCLNDDAIHLVWDYDTARTVTLIKKIVF